MGHFLRLIKARSLRQKYNYYLEEKKIGLEGGEEETDSEATWKSRNILSGKLQKKLKIEFLKNLIEKVKTPKTIENVVWKSFLGFAGGVLLTYIFFFFFYVGISFSLRTTTYICSLVGIFLSIGLAFSSTVRCYVLLLLPVFFSKQGRQALLAYALFLAFTGPARNTMHNMGILSNSMACGQEMIRRTLKQVIDMVKAPFRSIKDTIQKMTKAVKDVVDTVKVFVMKIKRIIVSVLQVIKKATTWLGSIINFCNKKIGTPFQRCMKTFDDAIADCKAKLGIMSFMCHVVHVVKGLCYTVKWLDFICMFTEFVSDKIIGVVKRKLREFNLQMKNMFYVSIEFSHSYEFETSASNSTKQISRTILQKISEKVEKLQNLFSFMGFLFGFFFLLVFFKVYYYKYKYLSSDRYDNIYISKYIIELDMKRAGMDRETVLPLELREKRRFGKAQKKSISSESYKYRDEKVRIESENLLRKVNEGKKRVAFSALPKYYFQAQKKIISSESLQISVIEMRRFFLQKKNLRTFSEKQTRPTAIRLLRDEKIRMAQSMFLLSMASFKIITFIVCDYSLYWVLLTIYEAGQDTPNDAEASKMGLHVQGNGVLAKFYRNLGKTFEIPPNPNMHLNPLHCLPDPIPPDLGRYYQIGFLVMLSWLLTVTEAYGLRLRNVVMSYYYPDRARERAVWLYNHILRTRGTFVRFARRQLRRRFQNKDGPPIEKFSLFQRLFASFPLLGLIFEKPKINACLLCGVIETQNEPLKRCKTPDCPGRYCLKCYFTLNNICTICQHPIEYGDISDISEEIDSSEEELYRRERYISSRSPNDDEGRFMTFKDLEIRDSFKDVEENKMIDYAKLGDLYTNKDELRKRLKEALRKRLLNLQEKQLKNSKINMYRKAKFKLKNFISKVKKNKLEKMHKTKSLTRKISDKIKSFKEKFQKRESEEENFHVEKARTPFFFDLKNKKLIPIPETKEDYEKLKNEMKAKINFLKQKKELERKIMEKIKELKAKDSFRNHGEEQEEIRQKEESESGKAQNKYEILGYSRVQTERNSDNWVVETKKLENIMESSSTIPTDEDYIIVDDDEDDDDDDDEKKPLLHF